LIYKLTAKNKETGESGGVLKFNEDGFTLSIPFIKGNTDYEEYLKWLAEGNTPEPPDPQPEPVNMPTMQEEIAALKLVVGMLMEGNDAV